MNEPRLTNIHRAPYEERQTERGASYRCLDLSGTHLGASIEELAPQATSSVHHCHCAEEEHVLVLEGAATLHLGEDEIPLTEGDHVWFPAGEAVPHHIENSSDRSFRFLVFGERKQDDVVVYPERSVVVVKSAAGVARFAYTGAAQE